MDQFQQQQQQQEQQRQQTAATQSYDNNTPKLYMSALRSGSRLPHGTLSALSSSATS